MVEYFNSVNQRPSMMRIQNEAEVQLMQTVFAMPHFAACKSIAVGPILTFPVGCVVVISLQTWAVPLSAVAAGGDGVAEVQISSNHYESYRVLIMMHLRAAARSERTVVPVAALAVVLASPGF